MPSTHLMRLFIHHLEANESLQPRSSQLVYVLDGRLRGDDGHVTVTGDGRRLEAAMVAAADGGPARVLRFELGVVGGAMHTDGGDLQLESEFELVDDEPYLLRLDRVDLPPGGTAYLHTHPGPGIRYLVEGAIRIDREDESIDVAVHESWFEGPSDPVQATGSATSATAFVRAMVLPRDFLGRSSIQYQRPEDADKPKPQRYTRFVDEALELSEVAGR